jgi:Na+-driven multidrug efflux pump
MEQQSWIEKLKERWQIRNTWQVILILVVFACTGFTVLFLKDPILTLLSGKEEPTTTGTVLYYVFILPLYNVLLLAYGFIFGQFHFFWAFEKRFFTRITSIFKKHK